jgi:hypothetical protein
VVVALAFRGAVRAGDAITAETVVGPASWGDGEQAMRGGRFWIAGRLNTEALTHSKDRDVKVGPGWPGCALSTC